MNGGQRGEKKRGERTRGEVEGESRAVWGMDRMGMRGGKRHMVKT